MLFFVVSTQGMYYICLLLLLLLWHQNRFLSHIHGRSCLVKTPLLIIYPVPQFCKCSVLPIAFYANNTMYFHTHVYSFHIKKNHTALNRSPIRLAIQFTSSALSFTWQCQQIILRYTRSSASLPRNLV